jgi:hypothetical protein
MGWAVGYDTNWHRFVGYGVPAYCDHPGCMKEIDRGLSYVCGHDVYGGEFGCGLFFCGEHQGFGGTQLCERCTYHKEPFDPTPEHPTWLKHVLRDASWAKWRRENPNDVKRMRAALKAAAGSVVLAVDPSWSTPKQ